MMRGPWLESGSAAGLQSRRKPVWLVRHGERGGGTAQEGAGTRVFARYNIATPLIGEGAAVASAPDETAAAR